MDGMGWDGMEGHGWIDGRMEEIEGAKENQRMGTYFEGVIDFFYMKKIHGNCKVYGIVFEGGKKSLEG